MASLAMFYHQRRGRRDIEIERRNRWREKVRKCVI
jgi:hypothetical protein